MRTHSRRASVRAGQMPEGIASEQALSNPILVRFISDVPHARRVRAALQRELRRALQGTMGGGPTYVERVTEDTMSPGEIRACYRLYAAYHRSRRPAVVGHFGHLRKMLASFAAQLFGRGALAAR
jgi:hypothetical protein